jgi:hypothetical protein
MQISTKIVGLWLGLLFSSISGYCQDGPVKKIVDSIGNGVVVVDPDHELGKPIAGIAQGGCRVNNAVAAVSTRNTSGFVEALKGARESYATAADSLQKLARKPAFAKELPPSPYRDVVPAALRDIKTLSDILDLMQRRAAASVEIIDRILAGKSSKHDLDLLVQNSTDITRYLMVFMNVASETQSP